MRVLLIGWSGVKSKYLSKYIGLYENLGYKADQYCPSVLEPLNAHGLVNAEKNLNEKIKQSDLVHVFSSGYYLYLMGQTHFYSPHKHKLIIDSSPINPVPSNIIKNFGLPSYLASSVETLWYLQTEYYRKKLSPGELKKFHHHNENDFIMKELKRRMWLKQPETLLLYSQNDKLICKDYLQQFKEKHKPHVVMFDKSGHVDLFRREPSKYQDSIINFIN